MKKQSYNDFKQTLSLLEKLQQFKIPLTRFIENTVYSNGEESDESLCEFFLLQDNEEMFEDIDLELETTVLKLARLLELKETDLKSKL